IAEQPGQIELVIVGPRFAVTRRRGRDPQRNRWKDGRFEDALWTEERHTSALEEKSLGEHHPWQRVAMELALPVEKIERGEANTLIEVGRRSVRSYVPVPGRSSRYMARRRDSSRSPRYAPRLRRTTQSV